MSCGCRSVAQTVASGVVGLTMSVLGPSATPEVIAERTVTCDGCDEKTRIGGQSFCGRCMCYLPALRRIREPQCEKFIR